MAPPQAVLSQMRIFDCSSGSIPVIPVKRSANRNPLAWQLVSELAPLSRTQALEMSRHRVSLRSPGVTSESNVSVIAITLPPQETAGKSL